MSETRRPGRSAGIPIARIAGIDIRADYSWLIAVVLIVWSLATGYYPAVSPGQAAATYWALGIASALALFASVVIHEISHSLVARSRGLGVRAITLFIFGGASEIDAEAQHPGDEFWMAVAGPLASFVIAAISWPLVRVAGDGALATVLEYIAAVNVLLGVFNLIPGFPLDGGRIFRATIWRLTGDLRQATNWASYAGQMVGWLLVFVGAMQLFGGNAFGGMWIALIGFFLTNAAGSVRRDVDVRAQLQALRVRDLVERAPTADPETSVQDFVIQHAVHGRRALLVARDGAVVGIVTVTDLKDLPREAWSHTPIGQLMTRTPLTTVDLDDDLATALELMVRADVNQLPVLDHERDVGLITRADVLRLIQLRSELGMKVDERAPRGRAA